jgi:ankyrin repeat protein
LKGDNLRTWVDIYGDTPLTAILKNWKVEDKKLQLRHLVQQLIRRRMNVNMRDRNGDTALAIAAFRGLRPCVVTLLRSGAMSNSRNYRGIGIITTATKEMEQSKKERNDKCYARIFSCITLLSDCGAKPEPTEHEEWLSSSVGLLVVPIYEEDFSH